MISDVDLLATNATLITGILIFLTIAPFSGNIRQIIEKRTLLWTIYITLSLFALSTAVIFFVVDVPELSLFITKLLTLAGIVGIVVATANVMRGVRGVRGLSKVQGT